MYDIFIKTSCCHKKIKVASMDYYFNAIERKNSLIETFGKNNVSTMTKVMGIEQPLVTATTSE